MIMAVSGVMYLKCCIFSPASKSEPDNNRVGADGFIYDEGAWRVGKEGEEGGQAKI